MQVTVLQTFIKISETFKFLRWINHSRSLYYVKYRNGIFFTNPESKIMNGKFHWAVITEWQLAVSEWNLKRNGNKKKAGATLISYSLNRFIWRNWASLLIRNLFCFGFKLFSYLPLTFLMYSLDLDISPWLLFLNFSL